ncbi:MAG: protein phosphatase 2C domain-containing protein [Oscillibacter sp.]|nr:protein phosphatase 2C domain-containing protein [Oscillibacter sp.]
METADNGLRLYTFHKTARGTSHINKGIPCEDASGSFPEEDAGTSHRYFIAAVADGHGAAQCFRSDTGARLAVEAAVSCLKAAAEIISESEENAAWFKEISRSPHERGIFLRQLTNAILFTWYHAVDGDLSQTPVTPSQQEQFPDALGKPYRIYGSTLIAALWTPSGLILIQQGDGRCVVFYEGEEAPAEPIPWDEKCHENVTTSLCDGDAPFRIRAVFLPLSGGRRPVACFLGTDGVEDAFRDTYTDDGHDETATLKPMEGVSVFYKDALCRIAGDVRTFHAELDTWIEDFSVRGMFNRGGSGDDVSVAGIVDFSRLGSAANRPLIERFRQDVERYRLEEELFWLQDSLRSKSRKRDILESRKDELVRRRTKHREYVEALQEYEAYQKQYNEIERAKSETEKKLRELTNQQTPTPPPETPLPTVAADNAPSREETIRRQQEETIRRQQEGLNHQIQELKRQKAEQERQLQKIQRMKEAQRLSAIQWFQTAIGGLQGELNRKASLMAVAKQQTDEAYAAYMREGERSPAFRSAFRRSVDAGRNTRITLSEQEMKETYAVGEKRRLYTMADQSLKTIEYEYMNLKAQKEYYESCLASLTGEGGGTA